MIKMIVFDMAGTTVDENNTVYKTLQQAINNAGFTVTLDQVLAEGAGKEKLQAIKSILETYSPNTLVETADAIYADFIVLLKTAYEKNDVLPQPGADKLFAELINRQVLIVLNTGYNKETAQSLLKKLNWDEGVDYDGLVTASDVNKNRPNPDMILAAMERFKITDPAMVIKVGDSIIDIEEGRNAGCIYNIGITTGAHTREQLASAQPDYIIDHLLELLPIVDEEKK